MTISTSTKVKKETIDVFRNIRTKTYLGVYGSGIDILTKNISNNATAAAIIGNDQLWWKVTKNPFLTQAWNNFDKSSMHLIYSHLMQHSWPDSLSKLNSEYSYRLHNASFEDELHGYYSKEIKFLKEVMNAQYEIVSISREKTITTVIDLNETILGPA